MLSQKLNGEMEKDGKQPAPQHRFQFAAWPGRASVCSAPRPRVPPLPPVAAREEGKGKSQESRIKPGQLNLSRRRLPSQSGIVLGLNSGYKKKKKKKRGLVCFVSRAEQLTSWNSGTSESPTMLSALLSAWGDFATVRARCRLLGWRSVHTRSRLLTLHVCSGTKEEWMASSHLC